MTDLRSQLQSTLGDAYTIERELGGGGMSRVFVAVEQSLGRQVVVKVLPTETAGQVSIERFKREIRLAASLQQANIVPVLSAGDAGGVAYYTMPFVKGESLRARLATKGALPIPECVAILRDVARALAFAHDEGVVHRDIKPENILLSGGTAVVTDFGIAKAVAASSTQPGAATLTQIGMAIGTPAYMAPEQAVGEQVDHRADVYALGVVAYELLTGASPFAGRSAQAMLAAHAMEAAEPILKRRSDVPPRLAALVARCMEKEQGDRPQSASAVIEALETATTPTEMVVAPTKAESKPSIAVLPLTNMSASADDEYFSDGITEDIIAQLSRIASLRVIARTSVMRFKKSGKSAREIASELGVSHVVEGSVRRTGNKLRIVAQLVDAATEAPLWNETFDRELADVFAIQSEVAERIAKALAAELSPGEKKRLAAPQTRDVEAYDLFQLGRFHTARWSAEGWQKGVALLQQAIARDPRYAAPHATLAINYAVRAYVGVLPTGEAFGHAESEARLAIALDDFDSDAHMALAYVQYFLHWDWNAAVREFERAIEISPSNAHARTMYGTLLDSLGRHEAAMRERIGALELSPVDSFAIFNVGYGYLIGRRYDDALRYFRRASDLEPHNAGALFGLGMTQIAANDALAACRTFETAIANGALGTTSKGFLGWAYGAAGRTRDAERVLHELTSAMKTEYVSPYHFALVHQGLGHTDELFAWLERSYAERSMWLVWFHITPTFDSVRRDPRFDSIVRRMGLPPEAGLPPSAVPAAGRAAPSPTPAASTKPSIAVLPLANLSASADDEYFSDGMTEDIIAQLSQIASLKVISRTSVMQYKKTGKSAKVIANELGASHLVEGSVRRAGSRLRIVAKLVDAAADGQLWAETFDREMADVFAIQSEVSERIAQALRATLAPETRKQLAKPPTSNMQAYELFLRGREHYHTPPAETVFLATSAGYFERAIQIDPEFAKAYGWLAWISAYHAQGYWSPHPRVAWERALHYATNALALDPHNPQANVVLALRAATYSLDMTRALHLFERALATDPSDVLLHTQHAYVLTMCGRTDEALASARRAQELDPLSPMARIEPFVLWISRRFDESLIAHRSLAALAPHMHVSVWIAIVLVAMGRKTEALSLLREHADRYADNWSNLSITAMLAACGEHDLARARLEKHHALEATEYVWPVGFAAAYGFLGEMDRAFEYLERACQDRAGWVTFLATASYFDPLRGDPRFDVLVKKMGIVYAPQRT